MYRPTSVEVCCLALVVLLSGCATAPPPTPTLPPPSPITAAAPTTNPGTASGTIEGLNGRTVTLTTPNGARKVEIAADARIEQEGKGTTADLKPGLSVGVTGKPDGTALSIRIFPAALGTPKPGQFPMAGANQGNLMTNSVITGFDGKTLTVMAGANSFQIAVAPDVEVFKPLPAALTDLQAGKRILATGTPAADGTLLAASVNILGAPPA